MKRSSMMIFIGAVGVALFFELIRYCKITYLVGSLRFFFSPINIAVPFLGLYCGPVIFALILAMRVVGRTVLANSMDMLSLGVMSLHLPTFLSAACANKRSLLTSIIVPMVCMALFVLHPVGRLSYFYALYWFIPMIIYFVDQKRSSLFLTMLGSTFVAHGVGAVVWVYCMPMTPADFWVLMPIVPIERMTFALGATALQCLFIFCKNQYQQYMKNRLYIFDKTATKHIN